MLQHRLSRLLLICGLKRGDERSSIIHVAKCDGTIPSRASYIAFSYAKAKHDQGSQKVDSRQDPYPIEELPVKLLPQYVTRPYTLSDEGFYWESRWRMAGQR